MSQGERVVPTEVRAPRSARVLEIDWSDGTSVRYPHTLLRGFCPCAHCQGHQGPIRWTGDAQWTERSLELEDIEEVGSYALRLGWADAHTSGIYTFDHLRALAGYVEDDVEALARIELGR